MEQVPRRAGGWRDAGAARHPVRGAGEMFPQSPPIQGVGFPPFCVTSQQKEKCSVALRFSPRFHSLMSFLEIMEL